MTSFTRILLNPNKRNGRKLLSDPQSMHAAVRAAFPPDPAEGEGRILWRVDTRGHEYALYIVAPEPPDSTHIIEQAGWSTRPAQTADYAPLLDSLRLGSEWVFRLKANPVRSKSLGKETGKRGVVQPHIGVNHQGDWLVEKASRHGFEIIQTMPDVPESANFAVTESRVLHFKKRAADSSTGKVVTLHTAQFDGMLRVIDTEQFRESLTHGIGRGKAYGCGLLTIRRLGLTRGE